jgi:hypothetical protein
MIFWLVLLAAAAFALTIPARLFGWLCGVLVKRCTRSTTDPPPRHARQRGPP